MNEPERQGQVTKGQANIRITDSILAKLDRQAKSW